MTSNADSITLVENALQENAARKTTLSSYIQQLEKELASVDALIQGASSSMNVPDDWDSDEEMPFAVTVDGAVPAEPPISIEQLEDLSSPFYEQSQRRRRYNDLTSDRSDSEVSALRDAVRREAMRQHALAIQRGGINSIEKLKDTPLSNYNEVKEGLDWDRVALSVPGRLPSMCKVRWLTHDHPAVLRGPWTEEERQGLEHAVSEAVREPKVLNPTESLFGVPELGTGDDEVEAKDVDWELVAQFLGTGRIAADCMKAYRSAAGRAVPTIWTPDLDSQLLEAVKKHGVNNMTTVAMSMPIALNKQQVQARYTLLTTTRNTGKWFPEEDQLLEQLAEEYPEGTKKRWAVIACKMKEGGKERTERQCRERWNGVLDKSKKRGDWDDAEDQLLRDALAQDARPNTEALASQLGRPSILVRRRLQAFAKGETPRQKTNRKALHYPVPRPQPDPLSPVASTPAKTRIHLAHTPTAPADHPTRPSGM